MVLVMAIETLVCRAFAFQNPGIFGIAAMTNAAKGWLAFDDPDIALVALWPPIVQQEASWAS